MKFSGQKFFILLGLFLIPILFFGALLREPVVNRGLLRITLAIIKNKVGASLKAQTWKVDLSRFAVAVEGIEYKHDNLILSAQELRAEFSPLYFLIGKVYFSRVWANEVMVMGTLPKPKPKSKDEVFHLEKFVQDSAEEMIQLQKKLEANGLGFEVIELSGLKVKTNLIDVGYGDLNLENFGMGHLKTELALEKISSAEFLPSIERAHLSAVLFKDRRSAYFSLRKFNVELTNNNSLHTTFEAKGRVPGDASFDLIADLKELRKWLLLQPQKELRDFAKKSKLDGYLDLRGNGVLQGKGLSQGELSVKGRSLHYEGFALAEVEGQAQFNGKNWKVPNLKGVFASTRLDRKAKNTFTVNDVLLSEEKVAGDIKLDRMGLCAMLRGLTVPECYLDLVFSGSVRLGGTLKPFKIVPELDIKAEPFEVFTDPDFPNNQAKGRLLRAKPAHVSGFAEMREKELELSDIRVRFSDETSAEARGTIKYSPTRVYLRISAANAKIEDLVYDFLTLKPRGLTKAEVTVDYDRQRDPATGRTDFFADYLIKGLGVDFLPLGDASGKLHFLKKILEFKPTLRNGPGTLKVTGQIGRLDSDDPSSHMSIYAKADDYEILVPGSDEAIFDGVFNFETHLKGSLEEASSQPFGGVLSANIHSMSSFGIPFERGQLQSYVDIKGIKIDRLIGFKGQVQTDLKGYLGATDSRVEFESQYVPIRQLGYLPEFERLAQSGDLKANGYWDQNKGWAIDIASRNLKVGQSFFPKLDMKVGGGKNDSFFINVDSSDEINIRYDSMAETFKAKLKDSGIFLGLTLINKWERVPEFLKVIGDIDIFWSESQGNIDLNSLDIQVTDRFNEDDKQLIKLKSPAKIAYLNSNLSGEANFTSGKDSIALVGAGSELRADGNLSLRLFDLFLPDLVRLVDGTAKVNAVWKPSTSQLRASAKLDRATAYMNALGAELRSIRGDLRYEGGKIFFDDLRGSSGESGDFILNGNMAANASSLNLNSRMNSVSMRISRDIDLTVSGDMSITGDEQPFLFKGKARVEKGLLRKEFSGAAYKSSVLDKPYLNFDLPFELLSGFQIKNSLTDSFVVGKGRLLGNEVNPVISGRFDVVKGTLLAKDNEFTVNFARVDLPQDPTFVPVNVNVQASTVKNYQSIDYRIFLAAEGDPDNLKLNFRSEPSLSQRELVALITLGYVPQEQPVGGQGGAIAQSASAEAFQLLFGQALGKGIQKQTGFDVRVGTAANLKQEDTIPKVSVYRKLGERVSATFGRSLDVSRPENNFKVDYRLLRNLNLTGVWENPEENRHSLGLDLRLEFEIK